MTRFPAVADRFYPGTANALTTTVQGLFPTGHVQKKKAIAVVSPHAGYVYSGFVAGEVLNSVEIPETVILLGPNHHGQGKPVALSQSTWHMPMGDVPVEKEISTGLQTALSCIQLDETAHRYEHSLEVQIPFLQALQNNLSIVPLVISHISYPLCVEISLALAQVIAASDKEVLIVASSDMTHYESRKMAGQKDRLALDRIEQLDASGLYRTVMDHRISMCGVIPVTIALLTAVHLGAKEARVLTYTDSGEVSGDTDQVVGYAGIVIS
ncbi:MAG: AmmeMemoRadiSam system protein B [Desulfoprunum sp.]|nr:AmmeMemoRadiSam system protein B [Desulfoprunum sp.]